LSFLKFFKLVPMLLQLYVYYVLLVTIDETLYCFHLHKLSLLACFWLNYNSVTIMWIFENCTNLIRFQIVPSDFVIFFPFKSNEKSSAYYYFKMIIQPLVLLKLKQWKHLNCFLSASILALLKFQLGILKYNFYIFQIDKISFNMIESITKRFRKAMQIGYFFGGQKPNWFMFDC
jgi:hypothetical protein